MEEEKQLSGEESLNLISRMIYEAKGYFYESGISGLLYGFSIVICGLLAYMTEEHIINFPFHPFYLMIPVFFVQAWVQFKEEKKKLVKTFTDQAVDYVWIGFFISALAALCAGFAGVSYIQVSIIIILTGLATFLTGMLAKFRYHIISSFICWVTGIISFFILNPYIYLLLAAIAIVAWVIPGFILNAHFKKQHHGRRTAIE